MNTCSIIRNPCVSTYLQGQGAVLFHPDSGEEQVLNGTGLVIWREMNRSKSIGSIADILLAEFDSVEMNELKKDITSFTEDFLNRDYFVQTPAGWHPGYQADESWELYHEVPRGLDISITHRCNLACPYCFYDHTMATRNDLSTEEWLRIFQEFKRLGIQDVTLTGGEALTRDDFWVLVEGLIDCRMRFTLLTNGTLIDENFVDYLSQTHVLKRCNGIQVSVDGSCAEIHDQIRGTGSFKASLDAIQLMLSAGSPVVVRSTINQINQADLIDLADLLLNKLGLVSFGTNDVMPIGAGCDNMNDIALTPEQRYQVMVTLHELNEKYDQRITGTAGPVANWTRYSDMERILQGKEPVSNWRQGFLSACGCIFHRLAVHHDGAITPCHMLPDLNIGRLGIDSLKDIWNNHPVIKAMRDRQAVPLKDVEGCSDCQWNSICNGGCPSLPFQRSGSFKAADIHDCYRRFLIAVDNRKPWTTSS